MKTKAQIVQQLLEEKKITAEEAVILLMNDAPLQYIPQPYPVYPFQPYQPRPWQSPFVTIFFVTP